MPRPTMGCLVVMMTVLRQGGCADHVADSRTTRVHLHKQTDWYLGNKVSNCCLLLYSPQLEEHQMLCIGQSTDSCTEVHASVKALDCTPRSR